MSKNEQIIRGRWFEVLDGKRVRFASVFQSDAEIFVRSQWESKGEVLKIEEVRRS